MLDARPNPQARQFDLNSDGRTDYLSMTMGQANVFEQTTTGTFRSSALDSPSSNPGWTVQGTGDFDGDGKADDLFWRNGISNQTAFSLGNAEKLPTTALASNLDADWSTQLGDFNGDRKTDVLVHSATQGKVEIWFMDGDRIAQSLPLPNVISTWTPRVGDFNGDGKTDLFWQDSASAEKRIWLLDGDRLIGDEAVKLPGNAGNLELRDFNSDGRTDILDRNRLFGSNRLWLWGERGLEPATPIDLPFSQPDGSFQYGDFNGDGRVDILAQSPGQGASIWQISTNGEVDVKPFLDTFIFPNGLQ
jgi:FG-GAP-like repeat